MNAGLRLQERPAIVLAHSPAFRLGTVEVRPATRELIGPAAREVIEPRVMQVLVALHDAGGEILSRDDLVALCWDGRAVSEDAINRVLSKLRKLGDGVGDGSFGIETITKVGYRLVTRDGATPAPTLHVGAQPASGLSRRALLSAAGLLAAGAAGTAWWGLGTDEPAVPPEAADFYRRANEAMREGSAEDSAKAVGFLREATALAPHSAEIWAKLAIAYHINRFSVPPSEGENLRERALSATRRALELDPGNATARAAGAFDFRLYRNWFRIEQVAGQALRLDPAQFDALSLAMHVQSHVGRIRDAIATVEEMGEAALAPTVQFRLPVLLWSAGRLEEAERVMDRAMGLWARNSSVWFTRFWLYARTGRGREALAMMEDRATRPPGIPDWNFEINALCARALMTRAPDDIRAALESNRKAAPLGTGFAENAVLTASQLGLLDEAFALAEGYFFGRGFTIGSARFTSQQAGYTGPVRFTGWLWAPSTRPMRRDPRFLPLVREIGLVDYWRESGTRPDFAAEFGLRL
jgi:DNA-binding winged helix-turn-helix (wHTH) protein/tetratricopeptide (TPR) repeat protein